MPNSAPTTANSTKSPAQTTTQPQKNRRKSAKRFRPQGARDLALSVLQRMDRGDAVQQALDQVLTAHRDAMDTRDAALCTEMVYGYLRTALRIEAVLGRVMQTPGRVPRPLQHILGLGVHSLLFLDKIPDHAVVNWCVERGGSFGKKMAGLTNAVLRSVQRLGDEPQHKDFYAVKAQNALHARCLFYATPLWMGELWQQAYGAEACERLLARSFAQPWPCVRVNASHAQGAALRAEWMQQNGEAVGRQGVAFAPGNSPKLALGQSMGNWHSEGAFSWQAAGSLAVLDGGLDADVMPCWGDTVWDACAGQGGKSLALLERGVGVGLCSDVHGGRLRQLRTTAQRLHLSCPPIARMQADAPALKRWRGTIVLDVPCSGLGTMARRPEIRVRRTAEQVASLLGVQKRMLQASWQILEQGCHLVYMTCTLNPAENEKQIKRHLRDETNARLVHTWQTPHDHVWLEGMYVAVLQKT